ncbi:hypothetical protein [Lysobacter enzymogenes]|uniref:hypothetical protein n=1 Tax=Lysobacter enzymogenes TaxID=69 RepID=UPI00089C80FE|nr:hypothetical protein [Lysobacter enzymogenes]SDW61168.1 hypothetical protein SAMN05421681_102343 [Lysobacter enzymogenes]
MNLAHLTLAAALALILAGCQREATAPAAPAKNTANAAPATTAAPTPQSTDTPAPPALAPASDYVLPGALAPDLGVEQLRQLFGAGNVAIDERLPGAEGAEIRGVRLFGADPTRRARLYFQDSQALRGLSLVVVDDPGSRWRLDNGVAIGLPLAELVRLNGKPLRFYGLDWDYGGIVTDWNGGALAPKDGDPVRRNARLGWADDAPANAAAPVGDGEFSSDDARYPKQGALLQVDELSVSFPGEDDL